MAAGAGDDLAGGLILCVEVRVLLRELRDEGVELVGEDVVGLVKRIGELLRGRFLRAGGGAK